MFDMVTPQKSDKFIQGGVIMKKFITVLLILVMCLTMFASCGKEETSGEIEYPIEIKIAHTDSSSRSTHVLSLIHI